jgi:hypothetical protein
MNKMILTLALTLSLASVAHAEIRYPDQIVTDVTCDNNGHLASGLSLKITSGGFAGLTQVTLVNRDGLGPFVNLGSISVSLKPNPSHRLGAPVVYTGNGFELTINVDGGGDQNGGFYSHVYADINGRVFNEPMTCTFPVHTM